MIFYCVANHAPSVPPTAQPLSLSSDLQHWPRYIGRLLEVASVRIMLSINNVKVTPVFAGMTGAGLNQINLPVPPGLAAATFRSSANRGRRADSHWRRDFSAIVTLRPPRKKASSVHCRH